MATFVRYHQFAEDLAAGVHNLVGTADTLKIALTNTAPDITADAVLADIDEIAAGFGYTAGGEDVQNSGSESDGVLTVTGTSVMWEAAGGSIGPFRYAVLYNDTPSSPADPLIGYWDNASSIEVDDGGTFAGNFGATLLTIS